jgi:flagellar assembly factor FliW
MDLVIFFLSLWFSGKAGLATYKVHIYKFQCSMSDSSFPILHSRSRMGSLSVVVSEPPYLRLMDIPQLTQCKLQKLIIIIIIIIMTTVNCYS